MSCFAKTSLESAPAAANSTPRTIWQKLGGNLNWHDYDLIFPVADLYAGAIS
jgi:hypothetical protein